MLDFFIKWLDEVVQFPHRYRESQNEDGTITHTKAPGEVTQEGTPQSAENFNKMSEGILENRLMASEALRVARQGQADITALQGEVHTVTLKRTAPYPAGADQQTINLTQRRVSVHYTVDAHITGVTLPDGTVQKGDTAGVAGHIVVTDKLVNGFKVEYTGAAKAVTVELIVRGGMTGG